MCFFLLESTIIMREIRKPNKKLKKSSINNQRILKIGVIGFGTVGSGIIEYFKNGNGKQLGLELKKVAVSNLKKPRTVKFDALTTNVSEILDDPEIDIVVEAIGGINPAREFIIEAMNKGKSVVTANKAVLSRYAGELFREAGSKHVNLAFEASVGGGIPIIRTINGYRGEKINKITAIINGTTNYILTQMEKGLDFDAALKISQEKGFAEANHILDTGGFDARDKIAILAMLAFNAKVNPEKIKCTGITDITSIDINFARTNDMESGGYSIKLLAIAEKLKDGVVRISINPALIQNSHPLSMVKDEYNAIWLESELAGSQMFLGKGAGKNPTTSAVISDIKRVARNIRENTIDELPTLNSNFKIIDSTKTKQRGYIRVNLKHKPGSAAKVLTILARHGLNVEDSEQQKVHRINVGKETFIPDIITVEVATLKVIEKTLKDLAKCSRVYGTPVFLPFAE